MKKLLIGLTLLAGVYGTSAATITPCGETTAKASTDAATIQAAIDSAGAGGTVTLGEGTFYIKAELAVTNGVTLKGQGWEKTILKPASGLAWTGTRCARLEGGAKLSDVTVTEFSYYSSWKGGAGLQVVDGTVSWCCISNNTGTGYNVHGVAIELKKGTVDHSIIVGNKGNNSGSGAGIGGYSVSGPCLIDACLVCGNTMPNSEGGGICFTQGSPEVMIRNTTIVGNSSKNSGAGLKVGVSKLTLMNCIVSGNMKGETEDNVSGTPKTSTTNLIGGDSKFKDAANGDYHLTAASPAKNAGTTYAGIGNDLDDVAFSATPSVGCYEFVTSQTKVENPVFDPEGMAYTSPTNVTIECATDGATIRYTTDGDEPTEGSAAYADPIAVSDVTMTIKARAYKTGMEASDVVSMTYTYEDPVPPAFGTVTVTAKTRRATIAGSIASVGNDGATACDVYLAYGTDAQALPPATKILSGKAAGAFQYVIAGLAAETEYHYTLTISNNAVTATGAATSGDFTTAAAAEVLEPAATAAETRETVQDEIDAAAAEAEPGTVTLGAGTFLIDAELMVTGGVTLVGQGWTNTVVKQTTSGQRCVTIKNGAKLEGVTLTGGRTTASWAHGAGAVVDDGTVSWCCISNNVCSGRNIHGGGVNIAKGTIDHSIVACNQAGTFSGTGGGIGSYGSYSAITIDACLVYGNTVSVSESTGNGGGIGFASGNPAVTIRNTTVVTNSATANGGGLYFGKNQTKGTLVNSIVSGNKAAVADNDISGTLTADSSNNLIGGDPRFKDAENGDYSLTANSPAKGTGKTYEGIGVDLAGADFANPPSMGCYEYVSSLTAVENPLFDPETGAAFSTPMGVKIVCGTDGATIYYTTDGTEPTASSAVYAEPVVVSETTTVKAFASKSGMEPSEVVSATYTYEDPLPPELGAVTTTSKWRKVQVSGTLKSVGNDWATACDVYFAYGTDALSLTNAAKVVSGATEAFDFVVRGLTPETQYHYMLTISNNAATVRGAAASGSFTTEADPGALQPIAGDPAATRQLIQEAIEDAAAVSSTGTVVLAEGLFELDTQLAVNGGVTLAGQGWDKTILKQTAAPGANSRVVTIDGGATVCHVTLTGGRLTGGNNQYGGGAFVADGTISWCCITNNSVTGNNSKFGGGVGFYGSKGQVDHSIIADNLATSQYGDNGGGGIGISSNQGFGGAILIDTCLLYGNRVYDTWASDGCGRGGGIGVGQLQYPVTIRNTTVAKNTAGNDGSALVSEGGAVWKKDDNSNDKLKLLNCIIADNETVNTNVTVRFANSNGADYCLFDADADKIGEHSMVGDPLFVDAAAGDYRLDVGSEAVGVGLWYEGIPVDLDGNERRKKMAAGCYEVTPSGIIFFVR